jgi:hypothetical protein
LGCKEIERADRLMHGAAAGSENAADSVPVVA